MHKTLIPVKSEIIQPNTDQFKTAASTLKEKYGFELKPQMDLLYVRSCLVTAAINENDDVFTKQDLWDARHTPVLKPANWQHNDKDIIGVVYSVQARDLNGNIIDFEQSTAPEVDFELWTEAVVFKMIHADKAVIIKDKFAKGSLFVSMEAWFDDYDYAEVDKGGSVQKIIARNEQTSFLDNYLKAFGGNGNYDANRIGRVLRSITFGGYGFVDNPANKRSFITEIKDFSQANEQMVMLLKQLVDKEENVMVANASVSQPGASTAADVAEIVVKTIDQREADKAKAAAEQAVRAQVDTLTKENETLKAKASEATKANDLRDVAIKAFDNDLNEVIKAISGATGSTPPEIAKIDSVTGGESAFKAKISWITDSVKSVAAKAKRADELESELQKASIAFREQEVQDLFNGLLTDEEVQALASVGASKNEADYAEWFTEKEVLAAALAAKNTFKEDEDEDDEDPKDKKKFPFPPKKGKGASNQEIFAALLEKRKANLEAIPNETGDVKPIPNGKNINSGVNPGSLKTPRYKIAGNAGTDPEKVLSNATPEKGVDFAGANVNADEEVDGFKALANVVCEVVRKEKAEKPGFDPVK